MALRSIRAFNKDFDVIVERHNAQLHVTVTQAGKPVFEHDLADGESADVQLP